MGCSLGPNVDDSTLSSKDLVQKSPKSSSLAIPPLLDVQGMETDTVMDKSGSNIITMEPFLSPVLGNSDGRMQVRERRNEHIKKRNRMQILPGVFELISYNKFLVIQFENFVGNINPFKANKEILSYCCREPKIHSQGDSSLLTLSRSGLYL